MSDWARKFHDTYEQLAPSFGYTTRPDTKTFDRESPNGRLMTAVCDVVIGDALAIEIAESDRLRDTVAHLSSRLTSAECVLNQRLALRREIEAALGITSETASDDALRAGLEAIQAKDADLAAEREAHARTRANLNDARKELTDWLDAEAKYAAERAARRCGNCKDWDLSLPPQGFQVEKKYGRCGSRTSECMSSVDWWPADHGCPSHRLKEGAK